MLGKESLKNLASTPRVRRVATSRSDIPLSPPMLLASVYLVAIVIGTGLLLLPIAQTARVSPFEALFTAVSATCVTGLIVVPTGASYSGFGEGVIFILIHLGGIGLIIAATLIIAALGGEIGPQGRDALKEELGRSSIANLRQITLRVLTVVVALEAVGALVLAFVFVPERGLGEGAWFALFHAASAFNNAGFDLFDRSLHGYVGNLTVTLTVAVLVIVGGLGWGVIVDISGARRWRDLGLHSRLTLVGSAMLLAVGAIAIAAMEWHNAATFGPLSIPERLGAAAFQSVSTRSSGFATVDIGAMSDGTGVLMMALMFIGAGAASTGGGIKVATFMVAMLATIAFYRRRQEVQVFSRRLDYLNIVKVLAVVASGGLIVLAGIFALALTAEGDFLDLSFEAMSAAGTVGLSRGITADLGQAGQSVLIVLMILGRIGPLTLGYFLLVPNIRPVRYPRGRIFLG